MRAGIGVVEMMFAIGLLALLVVPLLDVGRTQGGASEHRLSGLLRRQCADALLERVIARPLRELRALAGAPRPAPQWISRDAPGADAVLVGFEEDVERHDGLHRITLELSAQTGRAAPLTLVRLVRKEM